MCGISGIIGKPDNKAMEAMLNAMAHRGPDDQGVLSDNYLSLGMVRLAVIDLSLSAHQPMSNQSKTVWIVYNGEMYNYKTEREILKNKGDQFISNSDTEVVLKMYEQYGYSFLERMQGMFALCIYDKRKGPGQEKILLARDHFGIKPLLFSIYNGKLIFASEIKSIIASGILPINLDKETLALLNIYGVIPQPYTILENVKMLMPGHLLIYKNNEAAIKPFWQMERNRIDGLREMDYNSQVSAFKELMTDTVEKHMVSDVPIGAFLSGGLDSSLMVALMKKIGGHVVTFSVGYQQEGKAIDETDDALKIANWLNTEHHRVEVTGAMLNDKLDHIISALDQPSYDGVNSYFVSMAAKQSATVAISGTGGDEFFAGYPWFSILHNSFNNSDANKLASAFSFLPRVLNTTASRIILKSKIGRYFEYARNWSDLRFRLATFTCLFEANGALKILSPETITAGKNHFSMANPSFPAMDFKEGSIIDRVSALTISTYCQNQLLRDIDAVSMAHSLEVRVPFIDKGIADFAFSLPDSSKINNIWSLKNIQSASYSDLGVKKILVDAGRQLLPPNMDKQQKRGFKMPFDWWLKTSLKEIFEDTYSKNSIRNRGIYNEKAIQNLKSDFMNGSTNWTKVWLPLVVELWCRKYIDK
jgi:asparagine synthase (glutamine-hydrolysing)